MHLAADIHIPSNPIEAGFAAIHAAFGDNPNLSYFAVALLCYLAASGTVVPMRGGLKSTWSSIGDWTDRMIVVVTSTVPDSSDTVERHLLGQLAFLKGRLFLTWPNEDAAPLTQLNRGLIRVAERGAAWSRWSEAFTSWWTFITLFILELGIAWILWMVDASARAKPGYSASLEGWLFVIFVWPAALFMFQHMVLPDWREKLDLAEAELIRLSRQFPFVAVKIT